MLLGKYAQPTLGFSMSNFKFLKEINTDLFKIAQEAEKLYRDEYFEQVIVQMRRFGENLCKDLLSKSDVAQGSFDDMLNFLSDRSKGRAVEKEFIEDLYFLKKSGNKSVHGEKVENDGMVALECLQRGFECGINYSIAKGIDGDKVKSLRYDIDLLVTGKKSKKSLTEKYVEGQKKSQKQNAVAPKQSKKAQKSSKKEAQKVVSSDFEFGAVRLLFVGLIILTLLMIAGFVFLK